MRVAAGTPPADMTAADRRVVAGYSGWGGLSIEGAAAQFPPGFPVPEARGLIHEYYTPSKVTAEVARVVKPLLPEIGGDDGVILALEPSAGIGRFVRALSGPGFEAIQWNTVEWSELSARLLQAIRPDLAVFTGPFSSKGLRRPSGKSEGTRRRSTRLGEAPGRCGRSGGTDRDTRRRAPAPSIS